MKEFLVVHLGLLPRWFALPAAGASVLLGVALVDAWSWAVLLVLGCTAGLMAAAHGWNSFHDYVITGLDREGPTGHSAEKPYTGGQNLIRAGRVTPRGVFLNLIAWLFFAAILASALAIFATPWMWIPFLIIMFCAPWYSWAKLHWHPEIPLGLGFGPAAVWLGMTVSGTIEWWTGFLASLPFFLLFGVLAEHVDQYLDAETDWPKGARSLGMLTARRKWRLSAVLLPMLALIYISQAVLVGLGVLEGTGLLTLLALLPFGRCAGQFWRNEMTRGILWGLAGITVYQVLFVVREVIR